VENGGKKTLNELDSIEAYINDFREIVASAKNAKDAYDTPTDRPGTPCLMWSVRVFVWGPLNVHVRVCPSPRVVCLHGPHQRLGMSVI